MIFSAVLARRYTRSRLFSLISNPNLLGSEFLLQLYGPAFPKLAALLEYVGQTPD